MSSLHLLLLLYATLSHRPEDPCWEERDRLLVSAGHISPGVYAALCEFGYVKEESMFLEFRQAGSSFAGHVECCVPGVEWNTGNLGQGLSSGAGMALALKLRGKSGRVGVLMGDGEQQKGQIAEARRFAVKYGLTNLFGVIDRNHLQIGGPTSTVMPHMIRADYVASQWNVLYVEEGHDFEAIFQALRRIYRQEVDDLGNPSVLIARTIMGKGVSFMENQAKYHGSVLKEDEAGRALQELGCDNPISRYKEQRATSYVFTPGKADWLREGHQGAVLSYGSILHHALQAREELAGKHGLKLAVINFSSIKPLDANAILEAAKTGFLITAEDHHVDTGLGARVAVTLADAGAASRLVRLGVRHYGSSGKPGDLYREAGIDSSGIVRAVLEARANGWISG